MRKTIILFVAAFLTIITVVNGQTIQRPDSISNFVKAIYLQEDLNKFIQENATYPIEAIKKKVEGDVIVSFVIDRKGKLDSLIIESSPDFLLSTSTIIALNTLNKEWNATKLNDNPIDKKYLIIFRYRIYSETMPQSSESKAEKYFVKEKFDKALIFYNKAIEDNKYDSELFAARSQVRRKLGDIDGAEQDFITSTTLKNEIMSIIEIYAISKTRTRTIERY